MAASSPPREFVGLDNWQRSLERRSRAHRPSSNTLYYCLLAIPSVFVIGMVLALCLQRDPARQWLRSASLFYMPTLTPYALAALIWLFVVQRDFGALNVIPRCCSASRRRTGSAVPLW